MLTEDRYWLFKDLSGLAAEKLLIEKGAPGSFLIRESRSSPGNYTLSVRREDSFAHIRIHKNEHSLCFVGGDKFSTLAELINYYAENPVKLKENNGSLIRLQVPLLVEDFVTESARWFHGRQTSLEAQNLLLKNGKSGSFLVRKSVRQPGSYVLSILTGSSTVSHILINRLPNSKFDIGDSREFNSLSQIIEHYTSYPIMVKDGDIVNLKQPLKVTRLALTSLDQRIVQLEKECSKHKHATGFLEEFEELHLGEHEASRAEGGKSCNLSKNRYKYILPFDFTRVILHDNDPNVPGSDYINASYITIPDCVSPSLCSQFASSQSHNMRLQHSPQYISTQGVLPNTLNDMWLMIWQERASIVVILTKESERGRNKCEKYWPTELEGPLIIPLPSGTLKVSYVDVENLISYSILQMKVTFCRNFVTEDVAGVKHDEDESLSVYLFHFLSWPDIGTPSNPTEVLNLLFNISTYKECFETTGPVIVQCSSGIGRSGTLIVTDMLINYVKEERGGGLHSEIDIANTVQAIRKQRSGMVQTEAQYRFIYKALQQFASSLLIRAQMRNVLQPYGIDYTNLKQPLRKDSDFICRPPPQPPTNLSNTLLHIQHHHLPLSTVSSSLPIGRSGFCVRSPPPLTSGSYCAGMDGENASFIASGPLIYPPDTNPQCSSPNTSRRWYKLR